MAKNKLQAKLTAIRQAAIRQRGGNKPIRLGIAKTFAIAAGVIALGGLGALAVANTLNSQLHPAIPVSPASPSEVFI